MLGIHSKQRTSSGKNLQPSSMRELLGTVVYTFNQYWPALLNGLLAVLQDNRKPLDSILANFKRFHTWSWVTQNYSKKQDSNFTTCPAITHGVEEYSRASNDNQLPTGLDKRNRQIERESCRIDRQNVGPARIDWQTLVLDVQKLIIRQRAHNLLTCYMHQWSEVAQAYFNFE